MNQLYVYTYPHIPSLLCLPPTLCIPPSVSHPSRWSQSTKLISLCDAAASHWLSILHLVVYVCQCYSLTSSQLTLPPPRVLKSILYVCVFIPVLPPGSSEPFVFFFRFHIYVLSYCICFSLSDLLHSVWQTLGPSTLLQITQFCFFSWLSNIPSYICATSRSPFLRTVNPGMFPALYRAQSSFISSSVPTTSVIRMRLSKYKVAQPLQGLIW